MQILTNLAKFQDIKKLRTISLSYESIQYLRFKPEIVSLAHKDPYTWNIKKSEIFFEFYPKMTKTGVIKNWPL